MNHPGPHFLEKLAHKICCSQVERQLIKTDFHKFLINEIDFHRAPIDEIDFCRFLTDYDRRD